MADSANKLTREGVVCTCHGVEGVVQVMTSDQRDSGRCCTVVRWNAEHSHWLQHPSDRPTSAVYWCSRWTSGCANKLTNVGAVYTCRGV